MKIPTLHTERLTLREITQSDFESFVAMYSNDEFTKHLGPGVPLNRDDAWRQMAMMVGHWHLKGFGLWALEEKRTGTFIGRVGLYYPEGWPDIEVGWGIARQYWGKGYATEAAEASLNHGFTKLGLEKIISVIAPANSRSIRVAERIGETYERSTIVRDCDVSIYSIDIDKWKTRAVRANVE